MEIVFLNGRDFQDTFAISQEPEKGKRKCGNMQFGFLKTRAVDEM